MVGVTDDDSTLHRLQAQLWPGFLLVAMGAGALWWQRGAGESTLGRAVLMAVPVLLVAGVLLLLRAVKLKEQAEAQSTITNKATARNPPAGKTPEPKSTTLKRTTAGQPGKKRPAQERGWKPDEAPTNPGERP